MRLFKVRGNQPRSPSSASFIAHGANESLTFNRIERRRQALPAKTSPSPDGVSSLRWLQEPANGPRALTLCSRKATLGPYHFGPVAHELMYNRYMPIPVVFCSTGLRDPSMMHPARGFRTCRRY